MQKGLESLAFIFALPHDDPFIWGIRNSTPSPLQWPKIEAIQTSLFVDVPDVLPAMPRSLPASLRSKILRLLLLHWTPSTIAEEVHCCPATVYNVQENLFMYNSSFRSQFRFKDASWKIFKIAENDLIVYLDSRRTVVNHAERDDLIHMKEVRH